MAAVTTKLYSDGYYGAATPTAGPGLSYPITQQPKALLYSQPHVQTFAAYVAPLLSATMPGVAAARFVGDTDIQREGPLVTFSRQWATVPPYYSDFDSTVYTYPAYSPSAVPGTSASITGISRSGGVDVINTSVAGVTAGDFVFLNAAFTNAGRTYSQGGYAQVVSAGGGIVRVASFFIGPDATFSSVSGTIVEAVPGRAAPLSMAVGCRVLNEFLYTTDPVNDLPLAQAFQVVDLAGYPVTAMSSYASFPTSGAYALMIAGRQELVVECALSRYMGDIYCRSTRFVRAL